MRQLDAVLLRDLAHAPSVRPRARDEVQLARDAARVERGDGYVVGLEMVGMVVAGVGEVGDHHLRAELLEELDQARGDDAVRLMVERPWVVVLRPVLHARVAVAEKLRVRHAERLGCDLQLAQTDARDVVGVVPFLAGLDVAGRIAEFSVGAGDQHRTHAFRRIAGEGATGAVRLVVGVCVYRHQRQFGHVHSLPDEHR